MDAKLPTLIDQHVARRMRWRRKEMKVSQETLADRLGVTFQQIQKYERGANRLSAGRLFQLAQALETTTQYFYDGFSAASARGLAEEEEAFVGLVDNDAINIALAFKAIPDPDLKRSILAMVRKQAATYVEPPASVKPKRAKRPS